MHFGGHVYEATTMPPDVAEKHKEYMENFGNCTLKMTSADGHSYMVQDGKAWRATDERIYPPVDWSRIND